MKKLIIPAIALLIFIIGLVCLFVPFIPLGWLFIALASLLMTPYLKFLRKFVSWLAKIDKTGFLEKAGKKATKLYQWVGDHKRAKKLRAILNETNSSSNESKDDIKE
jgi:hypothetical protein